MARSLIASIENLLCMMCEVAESLGCSKLNDDVRIFVYTCWTDEALTQFSF